MADWRILRAAVILGLVLGAAACGSTAPTSPTPSVSSVEGRWRALLSVSLWDRDGGGWSPYNTSDPAEVAFHVCTGALTVGSQNGGAFTGWINLVEIASVTRIGTTDHPFCPPLGSHDHSGSIDRSGRVTLRLATRDIPYCARVSGDSSLFRGEFTTPPPGCRDCGDIVLRSTEVVTCTHLWRLGLPPIEHPFTAERRQILRFIGPPQPAS